MATVYKKHTHHQHVLEKPDMYIGGTKTNQESRWIYESVSNKMVLKKIQFNAGLYKIFDEIMVNARDEYIRSTITAGMTPVKRIDISVETIDGNTFVSIENDGDGISTELNEEHKMHIPELIFGNLLTSSNYESKDERIVGGTNGLGQKCCGLDTNVVMWSQREKKAKDIQIGDELIGDDGMKRTVLNVFQGKGQMYEVIQANGDNYMVNDQHILTLHMPDHKVIFWSSTQNAWRVVYWDHDIGCIQQKTINCEVRPDSVTCEECKMSLRSNIRRHYRRIHPGIEVPKKQRKSPTVNPEETDDIKEARNKMEQFCKTIPDNNVFDMSIQDYMKLNETTKLRIAGVRGECVQWEKKDVLLDPYVLGLWLGDGFQTGYGYACNGEYDYQLIDYLTAWGKEHDATITKKAYCHYGIKSTNTPGKKGSAPLKTLLNKYNLINNKHIPYDYLFNDRQTRLSVLAGLIDTDGSLSRNGTRISIAQGMNHTQLAHDIVFLARSLGFYCTINKNNTKWTSSKGKQEGEAWYMNISGKGIKDIPTLLPRKKCASPISHNTSKTTGYLKVVDAGINAFVGIEIDGNKRFLINDFTVTHNCTNIFSKTFTIDILHPESKTKYTQTWSENMYKVDKPTIKKSFASKGFVKVTFVPDSTRFVGAFNENGMIPDMISVYHTRAIELAGLVGKDTKVSWNGVVIPSNTFEKYIKLFLRDGLAGYAFEVCGSRWEVGVILASHLYSDEEELPEDKHISFVNGINTKNGGKHVESISRKVLADFCEVAKKKKVEIKPAQLKNSIVLFVNSTIVNPSFSSQSKEYLNTPASEFGSRPEYSGKLPETLLKLGLLDEAKHILEAKSAREVKKSDGKKRSVIRGMTKLEDALFAGTAKSHECTLILTEGDSAATSAISGLKEVGRERWGVFPLRGKLLNVRDITVQKFNANEELTAIKKIIGLEHGKKYANVSELRYGRVMIMADQDHDGSHIKGLLMNLFHVEWPGLMLTGFLCTLLTPILKVFKGASVTAFYSIPEFNQWKEEHPEFSTLNHSKSGWKVKYYKGLGTSTPAEAREWFKELHEIKYEWDEKTDDSINLAFNKKQANDRKAWLSHYDPTLMLEAVDGKASYTNFVNNELIHFSNADNIRSLPHMIDGFKPSQRKILFSCLKRNLKEEIRVAQLAGYVSEHAGYHHGEASLTGTIINMAQNFVGSNNINLLKPVGQFGSRIQYGADHASARYIHTYMEDIVSKIFRKEDTCLLKYIDDDGLIVEPEYYLPVVPFLAINGSIGIGTGYSTNIPPHNPTDIVSLIRHRIMGEVDTLAGRPLDPYWFGFKGRVSRRDESTWLTTGLYEFCDDKRTVTITELPMGTWMKDYKEFLDNVCEMDEKLSKEAKREVKKAETSSTTSAKSSKSAMEVEPCGLKAVDNLYNDVDVKFVLYFTEEGYETFKDNTELFEKSFKLTTSWKTTNMTCFDVDFNIVKYATIGDLLEAFITKRLPMYEERKGSILKTLQSQIEELDAKRRFIQAILDDTLVLQKKTDEEIVESLKKCNIPPLSNPGKPDEYDSYEYVVRMRIDRVKQSAVIELDKQIMEKQTEITRLTSMTASMLWMADLDEFQESYNQYMVCRTSQFVSTGVKQMAKPKVNRKRK
jgi:DNA topoisomerase-2